MSPNHKNNGVFEQILNILRFVFQIFMLIFKKIIHIWKNLPKKLRLVIGIVLAGILLFSLITCDAFKGEKIDWANIRLGSVLPEPQSNRMEVWSNSSKDLDVEIYNISNNEYYEYVRWCEEDKGFNIDVENYNTSFSAYNYDGYYLSLYYTDYNEKLKIRVNTPREMSNFSLPEYALDAGLPCPKSQLGCYNWKNEDEFFLYVGNTTQEELTEYKEKCLDAGFKYDIYEYSTNYSAVNEQGYKVTLRYEGYYTISIKFACPDEMEMTPAPDTTPTIMEDEKAIMPTEEYIIECLGCVPNIIEIAAVTEGNDPNGKLNKENGYYSAVFFAVDLLDQNNVYGDNLIEKGTDAGGCVESYKSVEEAKNRNEYLSNFDDNVVFNSGSHKVIGTIVVRTSKELTEEEQCYLESNIIAAITGGEIQESIQQNEGEELTKETEVPTFTPAPTSTPFPTPNHTPMLAEDETCVPHSASYYEMYHYERVAESLTEAGFTNIQYELVYDAGTGFFESMLEGQMIAISIAGNAEFEEGAIFKKDDLVIIKRHAYEIEDPSIEFKVYTVDQLIKDLEKNALSAKETHTGEFVEIKGRVDIIDSNGDFSLYPSNNKYAIIGVNCDLQMDTQKEQVIKMETGKTVTVQGKITYVGDLGYSLDVYRIKNIK